MATQSVGFPIPSSPLSSAFIYGVFWTCIHCILVIFTFTPSLQFLLDPSQPIYYPPSFVSSFKKISHWIQLLLPICVLVGWVTGSLPNGHFPPRKVVPPASETISSPELPKKCGHREPLPSPSWNFQQACIGGSSCVSQACHVPRQALHTTLLRRLVLMVFLSPSQNASWALECRSSSRHPPKIILTGEVIVILVWVSVL